MPDKTKKPASQLTNEEIAKRLFPPQVIEKVKAEAQGEKPNTTRKESPK